MRLGLGGMIGDVIDRTRRAVAARDTSRDNALLSSPSLTVPFEDERGIGRMLSLIEEGLLEEAQLRRLHRTPGRGVAGHAPVVGITGTGGAGKSSVVDELLLRFLQAFPEMRIAVLAVDPTRRRSGGALLGDRIRMNALRSPRVFMRSIATRRQNLATSETLRDCIGFLKAMAYDLVIVETAGIGQSDSEIVDLVDVPVYVMTSDYGAPSQLEKIDMLDFADLVVLNKFDRRGAEDALRDVRKQWRRNRTAFASKDEDTPVYPTIASQFNDPGLTWMFVNLCRRLREKLGLRAEAWTPCLEVAGNNEPRATVLIPGSRVRYLAEIAEQGRTIGGDIERQADAAARAQAIWQALGEIGDPKRVEVLEFYDATYPFRART